MKKCDISTCKACCCYNTPLPKGYGRVYKKKIANPVIRWEELGETDGVEYVMAVTSENVGENKCPFLNSKNRCNIYDNRPSICRKFGQAEETFLKCPYLTEIDTEDIRKHIRDIMDFGYMAK